MPSAEQSETFLPPLPPASPLIPSSTHPSKAVRFLVGSKHRKPPNAAASERPPAAPAAPAHARKKVVYVEPLQNATSRRILSTYYQHGYPNVPVDWRNGLDMRSLAPAQNPAFLVPRKTNTYETNVRSSRPHYEGGVLNQLRHGYGTCQYRNAGFSYEGEWVHGQMHGHGKLQLPDGVFEGEFRHGEITGSGMKRWTDGTQYTGEFLDGEMHGQGLFLRADGERYEGGFLRNQRSGHGVLVMPDGARYEGMFEENRLNGHGIYESASGDRYEGDWCNGNLDGVGEYWYANGDHYVGRFARNLREGKGCMFLAASGIKLDCDWERDTPVILPQRLTVESPDRLFWVPPTPPPPKEATGEEDTDAAPEEDAPYEPPPPPRALKELLAEPVAPGGTLPALAVTVEGIVGAGLGTANDQPPRALTPGGGLAGTQPQLGESGRLLYLTFGQFERDETVARRTPTPAPEDEEPREKPPPPYKTYPSAAFAIRVLPPERAGSTPSPAPGDVAGEGEPAAPAAAELAPPTGDAAGQEGGEGGEGEAVEDGEAALKRMLDQATPWPFPKVYPPPNCVGGFKVVDGRVRIPRLGLPEDLPPGQYQLRIGSHFDLPWGDPVEAAYLEITVE